MFCAGIDLKDLMATASLIQDPDLDTARKAFKLRAVIRRYQDGLTALEKVRASGRGCLDALRTGWGDDAEWAVAVQSLGWRWQG